MGPEPNEPQGPGGRAKADALPDFAVFFAACWIAVALCASPLFGVAWLTPGDFTYSAAMYYHAIMVPVLILLFLLAGRVLPLKAVGGRAYAAGAVLAIVLVGVGSIFNTSEGVSAAVAVQLAGMVITDCLGLVLLVAMGGWALGQRRSGRPAGVAFWLLFASLVAILLAAPLGHLAGWCVDFGAGSLPGLSALLGATGMTADEFQEGLVGSHSHLIVAALMSGLAAVAALYLGYRSRVAWRRRVAAVGLWLVLVSLSLATALYVVSAIAGWEPPDVYASGPNAIPLDDAFLTALEVGFLVLMVGLTGPLKDPQAERPCPIKAGVRISIFLNWISGFVAAVLTGLFIELNAGFYGGGQAPAPGALSANIYVRAHLLYPFLLLPAIFAVTLAVGCKHDRATTLRPWPRLFVWTSVLGMLLGLAGELVWFAAGWQAAFVAGMVVMVAALVAGAVSLWPRADGQGA